MQERGDGMSILIRGMEMPKNCKECDLYIEGACYAKGYRDYRRIMDKSKPDDCPLIELPPHGRLGDLDKLYAMVNEADDYGADIADVLRLIIDAPTVIEAEGETDA